MNFSKVDTVFLCKVDTRENSKHFTINLFNNNMIINLNINYININLYSIVIQNIQIFYGGTVMFDWTS